MDKAQYTHDCESCTFLGRDIDTSSNTQVDMYFCPQGGLPTIVMRYGNEGVEYTSAPVSVINGALDTFDESPLLRNMLIAEDMLLWQREVSC